MIPALRFATVNAGKGLSTFALAFVILWAFAQWREPHPVVSFHREVVPTDVIPGQQISIRSRVIRSKGGCESVVRRTWAGQDGRAIAVQVIPVPAVSSGLELYTATPRIPVWATTGPLVMRTTVNFRCNTIQRLIGGTELPLHDIVFRVIGGST